MLKKQETQELLDALADLKHDLGKYIRMPLGMSRKDASSDEIKEALKTALLFTRKTATETVSAAEIWAEFNDELSDNAKDFRAYRELCGAVDSALSLESLLDSAKHDVNRQQILETLTGVGLAIENMIREVECHDKSQ